MISNQTAARNFQSISNQINNLQTSEGSFSQNGMRKIRSKILPRKIDPPIAKKDNRGNLITGEQALKKLYLNTYVERLEHREIKTEYKEILELKNQLWKECFVVIKQKISKPWTLKDITQVSKSLKTNQARDPNEIINKLFKEGIMG